MEREVKREMENDLPFMVPDCVLNDFLQRDSSYLQETKCGMYERRDITWVKIDYFYQTP